MSKYSDQLLEKYKTVGDIKKLKDQLNKMKANNIKKMVKNSILEPFYD